MPRKTGEEDVVGVGFLLLGEVAASGFAKLVEGVEEEVGACHAVGCGAGYGQGCGDGAHEVSGGIPASAPMAATPNVSPAWPTK